MSHRTSVKSTNIPDNGLTTMHLEMDPYPAAIALESSALMLIDMQVRPSSMRLRASTARDALTVYFNVVLY